MGEFLDTYTRNMRQVGNGGAGVDAGRMSAMDPAAFAGPADGEGYDIPYARWADFCDAAGSYDVIEVPSASGKPPVGMVVGDFGGDGCYPVWFGENGGVVMEGRDVGTVVFPHADVKIYLDASPEERARRRADDPAHAAGRQAALADVASELQARDHSDRTRATSPLTKAPDAILVDTTGLTIEQVVEQVLRIVEEKMTTLGR